MFAFFKRRTAEHIENVAIPPIWEMSWTRRRMPDPGAENFSFDNLDLPLQTPIGAGVAVRHPYIATQNGAQPYFPVQHTSLQGIGQVSGGIKSQPLFNPLYNGYAGLRPLTNNDPAPRSEILPAGGSTV